MSQRSHIFIAALLMAFSAVVTPIYAADARATDNHSPRVELTQQPTVRVVNGHVEVSLPGDESRQLMVYALTGQVVKNVVIQPGVTTIELPAGYYIVKCDRLSQRVIVR